jgi:hypothetical protein
MKQVNTTFLILNFPHSDYVQHKNTLRFMRRSWKTSDENVVMKINIRAAHAVRSRPSAYKEADGWTTDINEHINWRTEVQ